MRNYCLILLVTLFSSAAGAWAGGSHSNGAGGIKPSTDGWVAASPLLQGEWNLPPYIEALRRFQKHYPQVQLGACPGRTEPAFPEFPKTLPEGAFYLMAGVQSQPLSLERICRNQKTRRRYGTLIMALHHVMDHPVGKHLISRILQLSIDPIVSKDPIRIAIANQPRRIGEIVEHAWFDAESETIFWTPDLGGKNFVEALLGRSEHQLLQHELVHVLQKRVLREKYPKETRWHDRITAVDSALFDVSWTRNRTSSYAAFLEGMANALERNGYALEHPFMRDRGNFALMGSDGCYFLYPGSVRLSSDAIQAKTDNEIYMSSAFAALSDGWKWNADVSFGDSAGEVFTWYRPDRASALIDAFIASSENTQSLDLVLLARKLDQVSDSDLGSRWLREFFFTDARSGKNLRDWFEVRKDDSNLGFEQALCLKDPSRRTLYLNALLEKEEKEFRKSAKQVYLDQVKVEAFREDLRLNLDLFANQVQRMESRFVSVEQAGFLHQRMSQKAGLCAVEDPHSLRLGIRAVYRILQSEHHTLIPLMNISEYTQKEGCGNPTMPLHLSAVQAALKKGSEIQMFLSGSLSVEEKRSLVQQWLNVKRPAQSSLKKLSKILALARVYRDHPELLLQPDSED